ncbi:hypothetical protein ACFE04_025543 [Oxalis oulophora]
MDQLKVVDDDADRISELPQETLQHIQSFLSMKETAQLALLSKTWQQVSCSPSNFEFDESFFPSDLWDKLPTGPAYFRGHAQQIEKGRRCRTTKSSAENSSNVLSRGSNLGIILRAAGRAIDDIEYCDFPCLENLTLEICNLKTPKIKNQRVNYLVIKACWDLIDIELEDEKRTRLPWYVKRIEFLAKFNNHCRELVLISYLDDEGWIFPNELRRSLAPPFPDLKKLTVKVERILVNHHSEELINSMHWMSPRSEKKFEFFDILSQKFEFFDISSLC